MPHARATKHRDGKQLLQGHAAGRAQGQQHMRVHACLYVCVQGQYLHIARERGGCSRKRSWSLRFHCTSSVPGKIGFSGQTMALLRPRGRTPACPDSSAELGGGTSVTGCRTGDMVCKPGDGLGGEGLAHQLRLASGGSSGSLGGASALPHGEWN